ncbi:MAG: type II toxin-antitoxin system prevent-host-death family antitoxin [Trueperaceae bacterium]|nr:type II toxin-antitoxin system prevent-host-death family antitoxin [Trueperaceae bacterium]
MRKVGMHEAKTQFSKLVREAEAGEEIVVLRGSVPVARIVAYAPAAARELGFDRGAITVAEDFDALLPAEVLDAFEPGDPG